MKKLIAKLWRRIACCLLAGSSLLAPLAHAETLYVRPDGGSYGSENGSSWDNAFDGFSDIAWGSGAGQVGAGDTLYVAAGNYSQELVVGASGTSGNPIMIRAAQDTHTGMANFNAGVDMQSRSYVTLDGELAGEPRFYIVGGVEGANANHPILRYLISNGGSVGFNFAGNVDGVQGVGGYFFRNIVTNVTGQAGINFTARSHSARAHDQVFVISNLLSVNSFSGSVNASGGISGSGSGPDGIQCCYGLVIMGNIFTNATGTVTLVGGDYEHQDYLQMMRSYIKVIGNKFYGSADTAIGFDTWNGSPGNHIIVNNEFHLYRGGGIRYYGPSFNATSIVIAGNIFYNHTSRHQWAFSMIPDSGVNPTFSGLFQNNVFINCLGDGAEGKAVQISASSAYAAADWNFDYNFMGGASVTMDGSGGYTQAHPITGTPQFVNAPGNLQLAAGDTALKDKGANLSAYYTTDALGVSRPQGSAYDLGPYEYQAAPEPAPPAPATFQIQNLRVGTLLQR